ncbi:MAG: ParB/RepB/Spo0J family partition protein [Clostridia bacterium]|nr:ParB/RepB/Spo0J family partition protein [Clostridia bacterium]
MAKRISRGLKTLLENIEDETLTSAVPAEILDGEKIFNIAIDKVSADPEQPRKYFGEREQQELENSIRLHGIIQPLILVQKDDGYLIVAGERRFRAAQKLGLDTIPAIVKRLDARKRREISLIENLQREDLNPIEEAEALSEFAALYRLTQEEVANRIGKARSSVANTLRLLALDDEVKALVRQDRLSAGHARAILPIEDKEVQTEFAYKACDGQMSVRELEVKVRYYLNPELAPKRMDAAAKMRLSLEMKNLVDDMKRIFSTKVKVVGNETKGRIYIDYFTKDDLQRIYELMEKLK